MEPASIWCVCGINLGKFEDLPVTIKDIKKWLILNEPSILEPSVPISNSLLDNAKSQLIKTQEQQISVDTKNRVEISEAEKLIANFLLDCKKEGLEPSIDIGQLRRERWRQWKRIPTEYRQNAPEKDFRLTPGYLFETSISKYKDEFCLSADGTIYKHQLNAPDPYPLETLLSMVTVNNLAEALTATIVWLLKSRQKPSPDSLPKESHVAVKPEDPAARQKKSLKIAFGRKKPEVTQPKGETTKPTGQETAAKRSKEIGKTVINEPETIQNETRPDSVMPIDRDPRAKQPLEKTPT